MSNILVNTDGQALHIIYAPRLASEGISENYVVFTFDESWDGFGKVCNFFREDDMDTIYTSVVDGENKALIPNEVTAEEGVMCFSLTGTNQSDVVYTSEIAKYRIVRGIGLRSSAAPTQDVYAQILAALGELTELVNSTKDDLQDQIDDEVEARQAAVADLDEAIQDIADGNGAIQVREDGQGVGIGTEPGDPNTMVVNKEWLVFANVMPTYNEIPAYDDLNDYTTYGWYICGTNADAATLAHCPTTDAFVMEVQKTAGDANWTDMNGPWRYAMQRVYSHWGPSFYRWVYTDASSVLHYGEWEKVMMTNPNIVQNSVTREHRPSGSDEYSTYVRYGQLVILNFAGAIAANTTLNDIIATNLPEAAVECLGTFTDFDNARPVYVQMLGTNLRVRTDIGAANCWVAGQIVYLANGWN